jgi:hypothetical protein
VSLPTPDAAAWLRPPRPLLLAVDGLWDLARSERHADFETWCRAHPRQRCTLWVGGAWLSDLACEGAVALQGSAARLDWARRVLAHYHGNVALTWPLAVWRLRATFGVSALHGMDLAAVRASAAAQRVALASVRPLWPLLLRRLLGLRPALSRGESARALLVEGTQLTVVMLRRGAVAWVHRRRLAEPLAESLHAVLAEDPAAVGLPCAALLLGQPGLKAPGLDVALDIAAPFDTTLVGRAPPGPDFMHPVPRPGGLAWTWLGASLLALAVAGGEARGAWQARTQAAALALPAAQRPAPVVADAAGAAARRALQRRLAHPWRDVFAASESPAAAGIAWLSLDHQAGGDLHLQGRAATAESAQQAAQALRAVPHWRQVLVSRLEADEQGQSFEIVARPVAVAP